MTVSLDRRLTLRALMEQAWQQVEGQARTMLKGAVEGLLLAERGPARGRGHAPWREGVPLGLHRAQVLDHAVGQLRAGARSATARVERDRAAGALRAAWFGRGAVRSDRRRLSQRKVVDWVRRFLGRDAFASDHWRGLRASATADCAAAQRADPPRRYRALVVDGIYLRYRRSVSQAARKGVLLVAVAWREGGGFDVLDWRGAFAETTKTTKSLLTQLWRRGLESVELIVSDGLPAVVSAAQTVYPAAAASAVPGALVPPSGGLDAALSVVPTAQVPPGVLVDLDAENEVQARQWARRLCPLALRGSEMVQSFQAERHQVFGLLRFPSTGGRHRLRTTNLGEGWFKHLRRYLSRFPGCRNAEHSEQVLGCFLPRRPNRCTAKGAP